LAIHLESLGAAPVEANTGMIFQKIILADLPCAPLLVDQRFFFQRAGL